MQPQQTSYSLVPCMGTMAYGGGGAPSAPNCCHAGIILICAQQMMTQVYLLPRALSQLQAWIDMEHPYPSPAILVALPDA